MKRQLAIAIITLALHIVAVRVLFCNNLQIFINTLLILLVEWNAATQLTRLAVA